MSTLAFVAIWAALSGLTGKDGGTKHEPENGAEATVSTSLPANFNCRVKGMREISSDKGEFYIEMSQPYNGSLAATTAELIATAAVPQVTKPEADTDPVFYRTYSITLSEFSAQPSADYLYRSSE